MSTWMVIASVWVMFAICVVLFVRGASPHAGRSDDMDELHDDLESASGSATRAKY